MNTVKLPNLDTKTYTALVGEKLVSFEADNAEEAQKKIQEMLKLEKPEVTEGTKEV